MDLTGTQTMADGFSKQGLFYVCALSWSVSGVLFLWLMRAGWLRVKDAKEDRKAYEALFDRMALHMDRSAESLQMLAAELRDRRKGPRSRTGEFPVLGVEPTSQVRKLPGSP